MIKHEGDKWKLYTKDGSKVLGTHASEADALAQEQAIEASKHRAAEGDLRSLHLLGATGIGVVSLHEGRPHLVVPVVALMQGVIHAVNADTPEFVPLDTLTKAAVSWNGRPIVLGHPTKNGRQCSANTPEVAAERGIGTVYNARIEGEKLLCDAWIDVERAKKFDAAMYDRLLAGKSEEVSVGAHVVTEGTPGEFRGKRYAATWVHTAGDHLAFLPGGRGACSVAMGCGTHRAAEEAYRVCEDHLEALDDVMTMEAAAAHAEELLRTLVGARNSASDAKVIQAVHDHTMTLGAKCDTQNVRYMSAIKSLTGASLDERMSAVSRAVEKEYGQGAAISPSTYAYPQNVYDDHVIVRKGDKLWSVNYTAKDGVITFTSDPVEVKQEYVAAAMNMKDCTACNGSGSKDGNPCDACDGVGQVKAAQAAKNDTFKAACGCKESTMTKEKKAELIASLVTDQHSGYKEGDEPMLEAASDARLEELRTAADGRKTEAEARVKQENELRAAQAKLTVIEGKLKAAEAKPTPEEWLAQAPPEIKTLLENQKAAEEEKRTTLIDSLKGLGANTEEELKAMPTTQLETLSKYAKVPTPNYSGRGVAVQRGAADAEDFTPPDPYAADIKSLQARESKAVN